MSESQKNLTAPILPTGVTQDDLSRAQAYDQWQRLSNKISSNMAGNDEKSTV